MRNSSVQKSCWGSLGQDRWISFLTQSLKLILILKKSCDWKGWYQVILWYIFNITWSKSMTSPNSLFNPPTLVKWNHSKLQYSLSKSISISKPFKIPLSTRKDLTASPSTLVTVTDFERLISAEFFDQYLKFLTFLKVYAVELLRVL